MYKDINIRDYGNDYGMGRVVAIYDNGIPSDDVQKNSFNTIADALAWISRIIMDEKTDCSIRNAQVSQPFRTIVNNISDLPF